MSCLSPSTIVNPKYDQKRAVGALNLSRYRRLVKNDCATPDDYYLSVPCGRCMGCLKDLAQEWRLRLLYENRYGGHRSCLFVTLTISPEYYEQFKDKKSAAVPFRHFIDNLRNLLPNRRSPKRFFISELGEERGRLHFHGLVWDVDRPEHELQRMWKYGFSKWKPIRSARAITYTTSYFTKFSGEFHRPYIFVSPGLGAGYAADHRWIAWHKSQPEINRLYSCYYNGRWWRLPVYLRKKIFTDFEVDRLKVLLRDEFYKKELRIGRTTYTDIESYTEDRERFYADSLRSGRSKKVEYKDALAGLRDMDSRHDFLPADNTPLF